MPNCTKANRKGQRERNYYRGIFGKNKFTPFTKLEKRLVILHIIPDRILAKLLGRSTNGIQTLRCRIKTKHGW